MDLNKLRDRAYQAGKAKGFYDKEHSYMYHAMEIIAEIGEASNADRKGQYANKKKFVSIVDSPLIGEDTDKDILHHLHHSPGLQMVAESNRRPRGKHRLTIIKTMKRPLSCQPFTLKNN